MHCPNFTVKDVEVQRLNDLFMATHLVRARLDWNTGLLGLSLIFFKLSSHCVLGSKDNGKAHVT